MWKRSESTEVLGWIWKIVRTSGKILATPLLWKKILKENSFKFNGKVYLQTHGTAIGTKVVVAFADILMAKIQRQKLRQSCKKPPVWKKYIYDVFSLCSTSKEEIEKFLEKANTFHPIIKFTAEISETKITFLTQKCTKMTDFNMLTHCKITYEDLSGYTSFYLCHRPGITKGVIKGEALRLHRKIPRKQHLRKTFKTMNHAAGAYAGGVHWVHVHPPT